MSFWKTYRRSKVWGCHAKRNGLNNAILREIEKQIQVKPPMETVSLPICQKRVMVGKPKKHKMAKWGRNKYPDFA